METWLRVYAYSIAHDFGWPGPRYEHGTTFLPAKSSQPPWIVAQGGPAHACHACIPRRSGSEAGRGANRSKSCRGPPRLTGDTGGASPQRIGGTATHAPTTAWTLARSTLSKNECAFASTARIPGAKGGTVANESTCRERSFHEESNPPCDRSEHVRPAVSRLGRQRSEGRVHSDRLAVAVHLHCTRGVANTTGGMRSPCGPKVQA